MNQPTSNFQTTLAAIDENDGLLSAARSLTYQDKGKTRHMTKAGLLRALERARKAQEKASK